MTNATPAQQPAAAPVLDFATVARVQFVSQSGYPYSQTVIVTLVDGTATTYKDGGRYNTPTKAAEYEIFKSVKLQALAEAKARALPAAVDKEGVSLYFVALPAPKKLTDAQATLLCQLVKAYHENAYNAPNREKADAVWQGFSLSQVNAQTLGKLVAYGFVSPAQASDLNSHDGALNRYGKAKPTAAAFEYVANKLPEYTREALFTAWDASNERLSAKEDAEAEARRNFSRQFVHDLEGTASFAMQDLTARCTYAPADSNLKQAKFGVFANGELVAEISWQRLTSWNPSNNENSVYGWELGLIGKKGSASNNNRYDNVVLGLSDLAKTVLVLQFTQSIMEALQAAKPNETAAW